MLKNICLLFIMATLVVTPVFSQTPSINPGGVVLHSDGSTNLAFGQWWEIYGTNLSTCTQGAGAAACSTVTTDWSNKYFYYTCYPGLSCGWYESWGATILNYTAQSSTQPWWYESGAQINVKPGFDSNPWGCPSEAYECSYFGSTNDRLRVCNSLGNCSGWYLTGVL